MTAAIRVADLAKMFKIYRRPSDLLREMLTGRRRHDEFWALNGLDFTVGRGEVLGIMGRNGAGKSTLLKILAGTLAPSRGSVAIEGRVSAILELGTGFNPNFTGRENVYMGGLCAGFSRTEIDRKFDEIVDFAELRAVIDQPFRTYSTGMQARLSFSTVMIADPEVLIVDEALSVGDAKFQLKCFDRFQDFRSRGKTILLVSHSSQTVASFCDRALLLDGGRIACDADPNEVTKVYHRMLFGGGPVRGTAAAPAIPAGALRIEGADRHDQGSNRYGDKRATLAAIELADSDGSPVAAIDSGKRHRLIVRANLAAPIGSLVMGMHIRDRRGVELFGCDTLTTGHKGQVPLPPVGGAVDITLDLDMHMAAGLYFLTVGLAEEDGTKLDMWFDALAFRVSPTPALYTASSVNLYPRFAFSLVDAMPEAVPAEASGDD
jgi:ABC-type polysaccharide/polyol phosphate transport system ATPase subunit